MMRAEVYWIDGCPKGRFAIMPRPRAGDWLEDEAVSWQRQGLHSVVSLLEDREIAELGLEAEASACEKAGLQYRRFAIADRSVPDSLREFSELVESIVKELQQGGAIGIHCRIGVGRSALVAVCVLVKMGLSAEQAWENVSKARGMSVPDTNEQREWVARWISS